MVMSLVAFVPNKQIGDGVDTRPGRIITWVNGELEASYSRWSRQSKD